MRRIRIRLDGCQVWDIQGVRRVPISGSHAPSEVVRLLADRWLEYFECHKCGRFDYCKFAKKHPVNLARSVDIQCGVAMAALGALITRNAPFLTRTRKTTLQSFLDGAYHFTRFVFEAEVRIGNFLDGGILDWFDSFVPAAFGQLVPLRLHLDEMSRTFGQHPRFRAREAVLLVEGESEAAFVNRLKHSGLAWFLFIHRVEPYRGRGNKGRKRIEMLLAKYQSEGITVHMQGDADGGSRSLVFRPLIAGNLVRARQTFVFRHDFESAVPPGMLLAGLQTLGQLKGIGAASFVATLSRAEPASQSLRRAYFLDLGPLKVRLAEALADVLNREPGWWQNKAFMASELGRFLAFLRRVRG